MATKKTAKKKPVKAGKKTAPKSTAKAKAPSPSNKRGPVLIEKSIKDIVAFIGSEDIPIMVSKRSLIEAKTKGARAAAARELEMDDDSDLE